MQVFLEKLLMFTFYAVLLVFKLIGWLVKSVIWIVVMLLDLGNNENENNQHST